MSLALVVGLNPGFAYAGTGGSERFTPEQAAQLAESAVNVDVQLAGETLPPGTCGENLTWTLQGDVLTISGTGPMDDFTGGDAPWAEVKDTIKSVVIEPGATTVGSSAFMECPSLASVSIPEGVTSFGGLAFLGCRSLGEISLPASFESFGGQCFDYSPNLELSVPAGNPNFASRDGVLYSKDMAEIKAWPSARGQVAVPEGTKSLAEGLFYGNDAVTAVALPQGLQTIGRQAFAFTSVAEMTIPASVTRVGDGAFWTCAKLESVTFAGDMPEFERGDDLFYRVNGTVYYPAGAQGWGAADLPSISSFVTWVPYDDREWNTSGTCEWSIDADGHMIVRPIDGKSGVLEAWRGTATPWWDEATKQSITSVVIEPGVKAQTCWGMFEGCENLVSADCSGLDTSGVETMANMFSYCHSLRDLNVSSFNTSSVTTMSWMFNECRSLKSLDLSGFDGTNLKKLGATFKGCTSLESLSLGKFRAPVLESLSWTFAECMSLKSLDLSGFNTSRVDSMERMFDDCRSLTSLNLSSFDTSNVEYFDFMFRYCYKLPELDLTSFNTSKAKDVQQMFGGCSRLKSIFVSDAFVIGEDVGSESMFAACPKLTGREGTAFDEEHVDASWARVDGGVEAPGYFTSHEEMEEKQLEDDLAVEDAAYRLYNPITSEHLFTKDKDEYVSLVEHNWVRERVSWISPDESDVPVYRLYNPALGAMGKMSHHYTADKEEADLLVSTYGWLYDFNGDPVFYSAEKYVDGETVPLEGAYSAYRLYNDGLSAHHFTMDQSEYDSLIAYHGWLGEGISFYSFDEALD